MRQIAIIGLFVLMLCCVPAYGQEANEATRVRTRELLSQLLTKAGPGVGVDFRQSQKQPFNFVGSLSKGLTYADSLEIVISVTPSVKSTSSTAKTAASRMPAIAPPSPPTIVIGAFKGDGARGDGVTRRRLRSDRSSLRTAACSRRAA